ncbi:hypothetical protein DICPUDRAFT_31687 [Dictyostelium purpureum]|uniref:Uncharacterized protein n=1 Tax=Dictyostelium purpureum TaxID=5786 RepID=F0ZHR6_DICPU|nr:uncharacterized protein DICPUDRAFT_31687 [Dictyostelium purpureum]EGC36509.1 hypothetical protein DICPUDRAFT_31687 [Dictyostelium purpureum]|eukprot:XP_003286954.1 hypothetical protein DICPUDRAFT_31687 [Dictyostelium purpureum]
MKVLNCLVFLLLSVYCVASIKIGSNTGTSHQTKSCFDSIDGFSTGFEAVSYNTYYPGQSGKFEPLSYSENGYQTVDFNAQSMFIDFEINIEGGQQIGKLWGFSQNKTQYVVTTINNNDYCIEQPLQFAIPSSIPDSSKVGTVVLGNTVCDVYHIVDSITGNYTSQYAIVDQATCALMSSTVKNQPNTTIGSAVINFFDYQPNVDTQSLQLPSICITNPIIPTNSPTSVPKYLGHFNLFKN